jgi:hypothetical protein
VLHGSGSRKAAEAVMWFSETAYIALGRPVERGAKASTTMNADVEF